MSATVNANTNSVQPSWGIPKWIGYVGLGMFCVGALMAALGIPLGNAMAACDSLVFFALGAMSLANAYTSSVRADLLHRIEELENRLTDKVAT
jgi:hypothetical protein